MEVTERPAEGLERRFAVKVPAAVLDEKLTQRLNAMKSRVHLKGFRKGKAPLPYLKKMYGRGIMGEVVQEVVNETAAKAFSDRDLQPAQPPHPHFEGDLEKVIEGGADLEYEVHAEILPPIEPMSLDGLTLSRPVAEVDEAAVEAALADLVEQYRDYEARAEGDGAQNGDLVTLDFVGRIDGEAFPGGAGEGQDLTIGSGRFIPGFEDQLVGATAGEERVVTVTFPDDYGAEDLAGKTAAFDVTVKAVKAPVEAPADDAFAEKLGLESLDALKTRLRERIDDEYKGQSRAHLKRALLDKLDAGHVFELPKSMVEQEFDQIWRQVESAERDEEDKDKSEDELRAEYRTIAERRVRLGLVLAEIGKRAGVSVPAEALGRALQEQARRESMMLRMQGQDVSPDRVLQFYRENPNALAQVRAPLYEERVVDYILERATVEDRAVTRDELFEDPKGDAV